MPQYDRHRLRPDLVAGAVVAALAVPQALGYAAIAGVPVEIGLYAVPVALIMYAIFGTSRQLVIGPVSTVSVLSGSLVAAMHPSDVLQAVLFTTAAAMWVGVILVVAAFLKIGWVAEFLSKPIVTGFVLGLTVLVILGELPSLLGMKVEARDVVGRITGLVTGRAEIDPLTVGVSVVALAVLFVGSALLPRIPWSLVVLVLGLLGSKVLDLAARGVAVVGFVPGGLPALKVPLVPLDRLGDIVLAAVALAFVGLAEGLSAARLFAVKGGYRIRTDQELLAAGASNIATGLLGGLAVAGSLSKTAAADRSGGRTQVAGLAAALLSLLAIVLLAPALGVLPRAVLSAIVVHAVWGLIDIPAMRRYRHSRRVDFLSACAAAIGVLVAGPLLGLLVAVGWAILGLIYRSSRVTVDVMGKVPKEKAAWGSLENHPERITIPGVLVLRLDESLFWVNAARVKDQVLQLVDEHPDTKAVVLDLESTDQLEITSADMLSLLLDRLRGEGIDIYFVRVRFRVRTVLSKTGVRAKLGDDHLWHSISQGVRAARRDHGLKSPKPNRPQSPQPPQSQSTRAP
ncbi:MAG TPA: SulP family inorganic anion transporter [Microlunatus sp.]